MFIGIISAILTTVFLGSLGLSLKANEVNNSQEVRLGKFQMFMENQDKLNIKMDSILDSLRFNRSGYGIQGIQGIQGEKGERGEPGKNAQEGGK